MKYLSEYIAEEHIAFLAWERALLNYTGPRTVEYEVQFRAYEDAKREKVVKANA